MYSVPKVEQGSNPGRANPLRQIPPLVENRMDGQGITTTHLAWIVGAKGDRGGANFKNFLADIHKDLESGLRKLNATSWQTGAPALPLQLAPI